MKRKINFHKIYLFFVIIIFGVFAYLYGSHIYNDFFQKEEEPTVPEVKKLDEIKGYGYYLNDRDNEIYKEYFTKLNDTLTVPEIDYSEYAKLITSMFIVDYYTLSNKNSSTDIGGLSFLYKDYVDNFLINAQENMYKSVLSNFNNERTQELPTVTNVVIDSIKESRVTYKDKKYEGYKIVATWEYEKDLGYETNGTFSVIKIDDKLYVFSKNGSYK